MTFALELAGFAHLDHGVLTFRQVARDYLVRLVPLVGADVHLKGFYEFVRIDEVLLCQFQLSHFGVVARNLLVIRSRNFGLLVANELHGAIPLTRCDCRLDSLVEDASLHVVLDSLVELLLSREPIAPLLLEGDHVIWESAFCQIYCFAEGVTLHVAVQRAV